MYILESLEAYNSSVTQYLTLYVKVLAVRHEIWSCSVFFLHVEDSVDENTVKKPSWSYAGGITWRQNTGPRESQDSPDRVLKLKSIKQ